MHLIETGPGPGSGGGGAAGVPDPAGGPAAGPVARVVAVELRWLALHLAADHRAAYGREHRRPVVVARVAVELGSGAGAGAGAGGGEVSWGWGECAALAAPTYDEEHAGGAWTVLCSHLAPRLLGARVPAGDDLLSTLTGVGWVLGAVRGHRMAKACLEMGVADAVLRAGGRSLAATLGVEAASVPAGAAVGLPDDAGRAREEVARAVDAGFGRVRVKIAPGCDVEPLRALRQAFPQVLLQADANGSYSRDSARRLDALDELGLACIEQPLDPADLLGHAELVRRWRTPVCLDESVRDPADVEVVAALGAAGVLCLKPARLGGIGPAADAAARAAARGLGVWCGGMLQTGLGRAVDAAVSGLPGFTMAGDLGSPWPPFAEPDPFGPVPVAAGAAAVHRAAGVGPVPDPALLRAVTTRRWAARA